MVIMPNVTNMLCDSFYIYLYFSCQKSLLLHALLHNFSVNIY